MFESGLVPGTARSLDSEAVQFAAAIALGPRSPVPPGPIRLGGRRNGPGAAPRQLPGLTRDRWWPRTGRPGQPDGLRPLSQESGCRGGRGLAAQSLPSRRVLTGLSRYGVSDSRPQSQLGKSPGDRPAA